MVGNHILVMAQIDDAPGESLARAIEQMGEMGAQNVQLLSSLGKKGRPGYVLLVDIRAEDEPEFAMLLVGELGVWGYHVLESQHKHFEIRNYQLRLDVTLGGTVRSFPMRLKRILGRGAFMRAKVEHDDLSLIVNQLGGVVPPAVLKAAVETAVGTTEPGDVLAVDLDGWSETKAPSIGRDTSK
jgi:uncharacterized protein (DUF111 family)